MTTTSSTKSTSVDVELSSGSETDGKACSAPAGSLAARRCGAGMPREWRVHAQPRSLRRERLTTGTHRRSSRSRALRRRVRAACAPARRRRRRRRHRVRHPRSRTRSGRGDRCGAHESATRICVESAQAKRINTARHAMQHSQVRWRCACAEVQRLKRCRVPVQRVRRSRLPCSSPQRRRRSRIRRRRAIQPQLPPRGGASRKQPC